MKSFILSSLIGLGLICSGAKFSQAQDVLPSTLATAEPTPLVVPTATPAKTGMGKPALISVTKAVGEVGEQVITSREVRINDAIDQALTQKKPVPEGFRILTGQENAFPAEVSRVLDEWIIYLEAKSFSNALASRADVVKGVKAVQDLWGRHADWTELEVSPEEIRSTVERKLMAQQFENLKSDSSLVPVSDAEALAYYKKNRLRFGSLPFESFKENIKSLLIKQQTEKRLAEWREVLRRKYKVRNFIAG